jgi:hypothetical protein
MKPKPMISMRTALEDPRIFGGNRLRGRYPKMDNGRMLRGHIASMRRRRNGTRTICGAALHARIA